MKILVVSGFLGAGKTTFIQALARITGKEFAILENEYGEAGIDGDLLKEGNDGGTVNIWEMTEGCICCSMKGDFAASVLTIANTVDPEYLVIEPTGVGYLSSIMNNVGQIVYERIALLAPVAIVDGYSYTRYMREYKELYTDQIKAAHTIFVSKYEQASREEKAWLGERLREINPEATIHTEHYSTLPKEELLHLLRQGFDGVMMEDPSQASDVREEDMPSTLSFQDARIAGVERLIRMLEDVIRGRYGQIIRAKGVLLVGKEKIRFDVADGRYTITGAERERELAVVFIGHDIQRQRIRRLLSDGAKRIIRSGKKRVEIA
ncbi:GTP-binding protein [Selenomonas sp. TAMA-11512]|uniref:CobW family GTP-binding protein n=1 Tax=Selenomonas sp. TAMA-11512 TaxID=3095337 RepID=UPI00308771CF|nr:GTP-binding protein [Selenomonas sp. TAMA-11512]